MSGEWQGVAQRRFQIARLTGPGGQLELDPTSATEMSSYELWCYIKGTSSPFIVDAERTLSIGSLREVIRDKRSNLL